MLKEAHYANGRSPGSTREGLVRYFVNGSDCIFTGMTSDFTSTINAAEYVIEAIAEKEGFDPARITFFDLITGRGYPHKGQGHEFNKLTVVRERGELQVTAWEPLPCPPSIRQLFGIA